MFTCLLSFSVKLLVPQLAFGTFSSLSEYTKYYLLYGGDRWFLYSLIIVFIFIAPLKNTFKNDMIVIFTYITMFMICLSGILPYEFLLAKSCYLGLYFIVGFLVSKYYDYIRNTIVENKYFFILMFVIVNWFTFPALGNAIGYSIVPIVGSMGIFAITFVMIEHPVFKGYLNIGVKYVGKFSLQFYIFTGFVLPVARAIVVNIFGLTNPFIVIPLVFIVQISLAFIGVVVCRKMPVVNILMGYY